MRMRRKTPATTIVELCSSAETGVGPSMAEGSHGCKPNWADFPAAAKRHPKRNREVFRFVELVRRNKESRFQLDDRIKVVPAASRMPMSPIRL